MRTLALSKAAYYKPLLSFAVGLLLILAAVGTAGGQTCQVPIGGYVIPKEDFGSNHSLYTIPPAISPVNNRFETSYYLLPYTSNYTSIGSYMITNNPQQTHATWSNGAIIDGDCMLIDAVSRFACGSIAGYQALYDGDEVPNPPRGGNTQTQGWLKTVSLSANEQYEIRFKFKNAHSTPDNEVNPFPLVAINGIKIPITSSPYSESTGFPPSASWSVVSYYFTAPAAQSSSYRVNVWARGAFEAKECSRGGVPPPEGPAGNDCMIDDIEIIYRGAPGPGDAARSVCGFGDREIIGPGAGYYNWYAADGTTRLSKAPANTLVANLTQRQTKFQVTTINSATGCESRQSTVTVNVEGVLVFNDNFNDINDGTGYPQGFLMPNYKVDDSKMNFTTGYTPVIVRYVTGYIDGGCSDGRGRPGSYPCYPGGMGPGHLSVAYDAYSYNDYWLRWPEDITTPLNPAPGYTPYRNNYQPQSNRFLIVDSKTGNNSQDELWTRKVSVRAGFTYEVRLKMMNAIQPGLDSSPDPTIPVVSLGVDNRAQVVDRGNNYAPISSFSIPKRTDWTQVTYIVTAPATLPADGKLPLSLYTLGVASDSGRDFMLDDIEVYELSSMTMPQVASKTQCDPGPLTLTVEGAGNPSQSDYRWFADEGLLQPIGQGPSITVTTLKRGPSYFFVQNRISPTCPSLVKRVGVYVYDTSAEFTIPNVVTGSSIAPNYAVQFVPTRTSSGAQTTYTWDWGDTTPPTSSTTATVEHKFAVAGTYVVRLTVSEYFAGGIDFGGGVYATGPTTCTKTSITTLTVFNPLCSLTVALGGSFKKDNRTGATTYLLDGMLGDCVPPVAFECVGENGQSLSGVVAATATAFADSLVRTDLSYAPASANPFLAGQGRMRPYASYSYRAPITSNLPNYQAGTFTAGYFNWQGSARARPPVWLAPSITTSISPDGTVLQEHDALGVRSTAKYGYGRAVSAPHALLYLQAKNADYGAVLFEGFETATPAILEGEDALVLNPAELVVEQVAGNSPIKAHTGTQAARLILNGNQGQLTLKPITVTAQLQQAGLSLKVWVYSAGLTLTTAASKVWLENVAIPGQSRVEVPLQILAQAGEWSLYQASIELPATVAAGEKLLPHVQLGGDATGGVPLIRIDDVRLQPKDALMTAYVYDPSTLRLLASFDDQHFALLYQYNAEGKLIRKQVETERGVKTLQETFYHTPQVAHP